MNTNHTIGMNIGYRKGTLVSGLLFFVALFLPFIKDGDHNRNMVGLLPKLLTADMRVTGKILYLAIPVLALVLLGVGIALFMRPSRKMAICYSIVAALETALAVFTLFSSKSLLDKAHVLEHKFMVSHFGFGFWIMLVCGFVTLFCAMRTAKVHPGYILLTILSVIWLFPITWIILTAFRAESGYYVGYFFPKGLTFNNFVQLFSDTSLIHFGKWWTNTLLVATCNCILTSLIVLMTAFSLSKTRFGGRMMLMKIMLIIGMFPGFMSMVAVYNILKGIGIAQTLGALILVNAAGAAMGYYIVKGFFDTIPKSLDEAALLDGATKWQVFTKITIPMSKPVIIYTVLTSFIGPWGDYIFPSMMLGDNQSQYTVALGLNWLTDFRRIDAYYTQFAAGALLISLPIVILFVALQRFYVEGMSGAVKG